MGLDGEINLVESPVELAKFNKLDPLSTSTSFALCDSLTTENLYPTATIVTQIIRFCTFSSWIYQ